MSEQTAITQPPAARLNIQAGRQSGYITPRSLDEQVLMARYLANSNLVPKHLKGNEGDVFAALQMGAEIGLSPMQALQSIAVINGRPSVWGDAALALVKASGQLAELYEKEISDSKGRVTGFKCYALRKGEKHPVVNTFTEEDAEEAGLLAKGGPWKQYRKRMLKLRARGFTLRDCFPDVLRGLFIAEEARDITPLQPAQSSDVAGLEARLNAFNEEPVPDAVEEPKTIEQPPQEAAPVEEPEMPPEPEDLTEDQINRVMPNLDTMPKPFINSLKKVRKDANDRDWFEAVDAVLVEYQIESIDDVPQAKMDDFTADLHAQLWG